MNIDVGLILECMKIKSWTPLINIAFIIITTNLDVYIEEFGGPI